MKDKPVILVVDDQPQNIELLEAYLVPQGYEIVKAANGEEALGKLSDNQIDLILLDIIMPGMDGFEVTRRVRGDDKNCLLPIILVTVLRETEDRVKGIEAGCDDFITMPDDKMELLPRVRSLLKVKAYNDLMSNYRKELESEVIRKTEGLMHAMENLRQEIAERKRSEEALRESEERLRDIIFSIADWVWEMDGNGVYTYSSQKGLDLLGESLEDIIGKTPFDFMPPDEAKRVAAIFSEIVANKAPIKDLENWNIRRNGERICLLTNGVPILDEKGNLKGYRGVDKDITDRKRAEEKLKDTLESLRNALNTTIQVMVSAVEIRDPYTSGHQARSADLASAIATEMGLSQEKIEGIRMVASIHDIGKLSIPVEILSKPTKLSAIEWMLIQEHAKRGYEILKDVESPWLLAEIVYQHHERMDGSGYPRNLKGDDILIEARILTVADVVEAMASHRPYRPGLGIDEALNEIERNKGTIYDKTVADACLKLFREKGFKLERT